MTKVRCFFVGPFISATMLLLLVIAGNGSAAESDKSQWISLTQQTDANIYVEKCGMCHRPGGMGTGLLERRYEGGEALLENRTDLQGPFIETVVRNGFNTMFPISRAEVSDEQLRDIIRYLTIASTESEE